ncbi:MAG: alpha/beta fold hydrolase [Myxococcota bacterium]
MDETRILDVAGRKAAVRGWPGEGPAVVPVHGAGGHQDTLGRLGAALAARGAAVHAPSLPGRMGSEGPPRTAVTELADWTAELLGALGLERPVVLGHSFGGAVALELALRHPERPGGLALVATGARLRVHPMILQAMGEAAERHVPADLGRMAWRPHTDPALVDEALAIAAQTPPATALADWRAADAFDRMAELDRVRLPALVLGGTEDELTPPKFARYLAEHLPGGHLALMEGEGHMLPMERSDAVAEAVLGFFAVDEPAGGTAGHP